MSYRAFFRGKRVFVTGHTGFKGTWLTLWLQRLGATVTGFALPPPSSPSLFELAGAARQITSINGDVRDLQQLRKAIVEAAPDVVFHLAAQSLVRASYEDPVATFATNVMGTVHLLECARSTPSVRVIVNVTSDKCYENREWVWGYREQDPMGGHDPYSASKGCAELVTSSYRRSFLAEGPAVATVRAGNVIGGGDWARDRLVPDAVRAFSRPEVLRVRNPASTRPWQHVVEPLDAYLRVAEALWRAPGEHADAWNFGPDPESTATVQTVVDAMATAWGDGARWEVPDDAQPHEARALALDCSKARARLGWRPRLRLADAISWTVEWYREQLRGADTRELTLAQIARYEELS